jgi:hypothetical protein
MSTQTLIINVLSRSMCVTTDGVWIGGSIYWLLMHSRHGKNCYSLFSDEHISWLCWSKQKKLMNSRKWIENFGSSCTSLLQCRLAKQIMPILRILCYNGSLITWTVGSLTTTKFKPLIFSVWFRLVVYREHVYSYDFVWLLLHACLILLCRYVYNRTHKEGWKRCANRGPMCTLDNFQLCGEPCFSGAAILRGRCLPLIHRRHKCKSLLIWSVPYGSLVWWWRLMAHFPIGSRL